MMILWSHNVLWLWIDFQRVQVIQKFRVLKDGCFLNITLMVNASVNNAILYIANYFYFSNQLWLSEVCAFDACHWIDFKNKMIHKSDNDDIEFVGDILSLTFKIRTYMRKIIEYNLNTWLNSSKSAIKPDLLSKISTLG